MSAWSVLAQQSTHQCTSATHISLPLPKQELKEEQEGEREIKEEEKEANEQGAPRVTIGKSPRFSPLLG
jgi:hypothetical protein